MHALLLDVVGDMQCKHLICAAIPGNIGFTYFHIKHVSGTGLSMVALLNYDWVITLNLKIIAW